MTGDHVVDVDCQVCGCSATVSDADPVRVELILDAWSRLHAHTSGERETWYRAVERLHSLHDEG